MSYDGHIRILSESYICMYTCMYDFGKYIGRYTGKSLVLW